MKSWIINICTAVFFITAVEMVLPNNNFKKYSKFVLGLILITVVLNPIVKFLNNGSSINRFITSSSAKFEEQIDKSSKKYDKNMNESTVNQFEKNINSLCKKKLEKKFSGESFKIKSEISYDSTKNKFNIDSVIIGVQNGNVERVQKVIIGKHEKNTSVNDSGHLLEVKNFISKQLEISADKIMVYQL
ncbi:stage III sporulation protein AF [Clostridium oryzae]|nr:stage III sporulation protein AF [Clostridium oryzae]